MGYRDDLAALDARHAALTTEVQQKARELEAASALLAEAKAKAKLPVLPNIRVAAPCTADWNAMTGDERVRECAKCAKRVYNLSSMTRDEAEALIVAKEGKLCVRYFQRADGTILLKDCQVGVSGRRKRRLIAAGAAALLVGGASAVMALRSTPGCDVMGAVEATDVVEFKGEPSFDPLIQVQPQNPVPLDAEIKMGELSVRAPIEK